MKASVGSFIRGLEDGLVTMNAGEKARLYVPWYFGYGVSGHKGNDTQGCCLGRVRSEDRLGYLNSSLKPFIFSS